MATISFQNMGYEEDCEALGLDRLRRIWFELWKGVLFQRKETFLEYIHSYRHTFNLLKCNWQLVQQGHSYSIFIATGRTHSRDSLFLEAQIVRQYLNWLTLDLVLAARFVLTRRLLLDDFNSLDLGSRSVVGFM